MRTTIAALLLAFSFNASAERIVLQMQGQTLDAGAKVFLKREMQRAGYRPEDYRLQSVAVVATGRGQISLLMSQQEVDRKGLVRDGEEINPGVFRIQLLAQRGPQLQNGAWQLQSGPQAQINLRRIILNVIPKHGGGGGRPPYDDDYIVHNVTLHSLGNVVDMGWEAPRGQEIVDMRLIVEHSSDKCHRNGAQNYGFSRTSAYATNKCRATFEILTVRDYR